MTSRERFGRLTAMENVSKRAKAIEVLVREYEGLEETDAADLAHDEIMTNPGRSDKEIAHFLAMRLAFP